MPTADQIIAATKKVMDLEEQLNLAKRELEEFVSGAAPPIPRFMQPITSAEPSTAAGVLALLLAHPEGLTRAEIIKQLGHSDAVHAALKRGRTAKKFVPKEGRWYATEKARG